VVLYSPLKDGKSQNARPEFQGNKYTLEEERLPITTKLARKVDKRTLVHLFMTFNLKLNKSDYSKPNPAFLRL